MHGASYNILFKNELSSCGFAITGDKLSFYVTNSLFSNNTVNNKPLYYWHTKNWDKVPNNAGQVILVNCSNITIENLNINDAGSAIQLIWSNDTIIKNNTCDSNSNGIALYRSFRNIVKFNSFCFNNNGIYLSSSRFNFILNNTCYNNSEHGIESSYSSCNTISFNSLDNNRIFSTS